MKLRFNPFIPPNMEQNFEAFLATEVCKDVSYCKDISKDPQVWVDERAEITPISYKSKQYGSDNNLKIRFRRSCEVSKGDIIRFDNRYYLATWRTHNAVPDSLPTNMEMCNTFATIKRLSRGEIDPETGAYIESPGGYIKIVENIPAIFMTNGNYELRHKNSQAGLFNDNRTKLIVQANDATDAVTRGDMFEHHDEVFVVRDINLTELDPDGKGLYIWNLGLSADEESLYD